jgi:hypothetical protein
VSSGPGNNEVSRETVFEATRPWVPHATKGATRLNVYIKAKGLKEMPVNLSLGRIRGEPIQIQKAFEVTVAR